MAWSLGNFIVQLCSLSCACHCRHASRGCRDKDSVGGDSSCRNIIVCGCRGATDKLIVHNSLWVNYQRVEPIVLSGISS